MKRRLAPSTKSAYATAMRRIYGAQTPDFVPKNLGDLPGGTQRLVKAALRHHWIQQGDPERGRALSALIEPGESTRRFRVVPGEAASKRFEQAVRAYGNTRAKLIVLMMVGLGFRIQEACSLTYEELKTALKVGYITLRITKGGRPRALPIAKVKLVLEALLKMPVCQPHTLADRGDDQPWKVLGHLLARVGSNTITQRNMLARHIKKIALQSGIATPETLGGWSPHMLRHIFSTRMTRDGAPQAFVKFALGHSARGDVTMTYQQITVEDLLEYMREVKP